MITGHPKGEKGPGNTTVTREPSLSLNNASRRPPCSRPNSTTPCSAIHEGFDTVSDKVSSAAKSASQRTEHWRSQVSDIHSREYWERVVKDVEELRDELVNGVSDRFNQLRKATENALTKPGKKTGKKKAAKKKTAGKKVSKKKTARKKVAGKKTAKKKAARKKTAKKKTAKKKVSKKKPVRKKARG
ncbi:MAG: hypothetical protein R6W66_00005 [Pelovirga sp.]